MIAQSLVDGILLGGVYALIGLGFSVVWGMANVINLAQGAFVMLGAYTTYYLFTLAHVDPFLSLPISAALLFGLGYVTQRYLVNLVMRSGVFMTLVLTFGLNLLLENIAVVAFSANDRSVSPSYAGDSLQIGSVVIPDVNLIAFGIAVVMTGVVHLFMHRTRPGRAIQATALNRGAAELVGIPVGKSYALAYAVGAAVAGMAGTLLGTISTITPYMGEPLIGVSFIVACLGGLGSTGGSLVAGLLLGVVEVVGATFLGASFQQGIGFLALVIVLVVRPGGLFGRRFFGEILSEEF